MVALIAAMLFLQMYLTMDVCCCLLASLRAPGWRPRFPNPKAFPLAPAAGAGAALCVVTFYMLSFKLAPLMLMAVVLLGFVISTASGDDELGAGAATTGLFYTIALQALHAIGEDVALQDADGAREAPQSWRPQLLCLLPSPSTIGNLAPARFPLPTPWPHITGT